MSNYFSTFCLSNKHLDISWCWDASSLCWRMVLNTIKWMDTEPLFCSRSKWKSGTKGVIPMEIFSICTLNSSGTCCAEGLAASCGWSDGRNLSILMSFRIIIFILYHSLHSCHSFWSHCWWLVWHSELAAVISWAQVWAINVWLGEIPQKRDIERFCFWKWFERCCGGMNQGDLWFSFSNGGIFNTLYGQVALAEAENWKKPGSSIILWQTSPNERWSNPPTHTYQAFCIYAGEINKSALLPCSSDRASPENAAGMPHCALCRTVTAAAPKHRWQGVWPPGAVLQTSRGSCLSRKIRAAQPHLGPQGEAFPVRDRITPLDTHSPFLWPSCPRSS